MRSPLGDPPGTEFASTDAGYALLAAVVEIVAKQPFEEALRELVLQPAGLTSTGFRQGTGLDATRVARAHTTSDEPLPEGAKATRFPAEQLLVAGAPFVTVSGTLPLVRETEAPAPNPEVKEMIARAARAEAQTPVGAKS